jgi:TPR repeat protein
MEGQDKAGGSTVVIAGAISGALPLMISYSSSSHHTVNGAIVDAYYRDWIAIGGGGIAAVLGLAAIAMALRTRPRPLMIASAAAVLALGGYQIARGFGAFAPGASGETRIAEDVAHTTTPDTAVVPAAPDPATCPDKDACDNVAATLENTDPRGALAAYTRACALGEKYACITAAEFWDDGRAGTEDPTRALALRQKGCELGSGDGCTDAGVAHLNGAGTTKDAERGRALMLEGCELGSKIGCKNLAYTYLEGDGVPPDPTRAFALAVKACDEGTGVDQSVAYWVGLACTMAADALREGHGARKDRKRADDYDRAAIPWYESACEGNRKRCYHLALSFDAGRGVPRNQKRAREIYRAACEADNASACNNLGVMLNRGQGGTRNVAMARELFDKACQGGEEVGCTNFKGRR